MKRLILLTVMRLIAAAMVLGPGRLDSGQSPSTVEPAQAAVLSILREQQAAWNRGDVTGFMKGYWNSPELTFAGSSGITRGWKPVLARYRKTYPGAQAMGQLEFSEVEVRPLGQDAALVLGRWHLKRASDELGGIFTLVFQRFPEGWRIIHDHTSSDAKPS
jgi:ketosteroid isomerase-like protein